MRCVHRHARSPVLEDPGGLTGGRGMMEGAVFKTWQKWVIVIASLLTIAEFAFDLAQGFARGARRRSASYRSEDSRSAARDSTSVPH